MASTGDFAKTYASWNPFDKGSNVTLSNGNLTATCNSTTARYGRANVGIRSGEKKFFSIVYNAFTSVPEQQSAGLANITFNVQNAANFGYFDINSIALYQTGTVYRNTISPVTTVASYVVGDTVDFSVDRVNNLIWFRTNGGNWNNSASANPSTGVGGIALSTPTGTLLYPAFDLYYGGGATIPSLTANFGATTFTYAPPSGFTALAAATDDDDISTSAGTLSISGTFPQTPVTWSPTDHALNMILSNGNLTATLPLNQTNSIGRASVPILVGQKMMFSVHIDVLNTDTGIGIATSAAGISLSGSDWLGNNGSQANRSVSFDCTGTFSINRIFTTGYPTWGLGSVIDIAVDRVNNRIWCRANGGNWNNSASANPSTNVGGVDISALVGPVYPAFTLNGIAGTGGAGQLTANFGATALPYSVPSGFSSVAALLTPEGDDILSATGAGALHGLFSQTEGNDTLSSSSALLISGIFSLSEDGDTLSSGSRLAITSVLALTEDGDTLASISIRDAHGFEVGLTKSPGVRLGVQVTYTNEKLGVSRTTPAPVTGSVVYPSKPLVSVNSTSGYKIKSVLPL
jgi:hypothetical protein